MASIDTLQDYDVIYTLTFDAGDTGVGKTSPIVLYRGSATAYTNTVYYRAGTSGAWTSLSVSGTGTTFPVSSTTMQVGHGWNKNGNHYMTASFYDGTSGSNAKTIAISQKAVISGVIGNSFMYLLARSCVKLTTLDVPDTSDVTTVGTTFMSNYAYGCSSLTSLDVPDTSNVTSVGGNFMNSCTRDCVSITTRGIPDTSSITSVGASFMYRYILNGNSLIRLDLPAVGWFASNNVDWGVPAGRLNYVKGYVKNATDKSNWDALVTSGNTLYTNYIRNTSDVILETSNMSGAMMWFLT